MGYLIRHLGQHQWAIPSGEQAMHPQLLDTGTAGAPRVIFKCPHIKGGGEKAAAHLGNYVKYVSTREGVERVDPGKAATPLADDQNFYAVTRPRAFSACP